jgi:hypothetical protein
MPAVEVTRRHHGIDAAITATAPADARSAARAFWLKRHQQAEASPGQVNLHRHHAAALP